MGTTQALILIAMSDSEVNLEYDYGWVLEDSTLAYKCNNGVMTSQNATEWMYRDLPIRCKAS